MAIVAEVAAKVAVGAVAAAASMVVAWTGGSADALAPPVLGALSGTSRCIGLVAKDDASGPSTAVTTASAKGAVGERARGVATAAVSLELVDRRAEWPSPRRASSPPPKPSVVRVSLSPTVSLTLPWLSGLDWPSPWWLGCWLRRRFLTSATVLSSRFPCRRDGGNIPEPSGSGDTPAPDVVETMTPVPVPLVGGRGGVTAESGNAASASPSPGPPPASSPSPSSW